MGTLVKPLQTVLTKNLEPNIHCLQTSEGGTIFYWRGTRSQVLELYVIINGRNVGANISQPMLNPTVMMNAFYCYRDVNTVSKKKKTIISKKILTKVYLEGGSLKVEELKEMTPGFQCSEYQPLYKWEEGPCLYMHRFERGKDVRRRFAFDDAARLMQPADKCLVHRGLLILVRQSNVEMCRPLRVEDNNIRVLELNGTDFSIYAQEGLDHIFVVDRITAILWIVNPTTRAITTYSLGATLGRTVELVGYFDGKLLVTRFEAQANTSSELLAIQLPEYKVSSKSNKSVTLKGGATGAQPSASQAQLRQQLAETQKTLQSVRSTIDTLKQTVVALEEKNRKMIALLDK